MAASTEADFNWNEECVYSEINMDVSDRNQERASSPRDDQMYAYAIGYYAGRAEGVENNPYAPDDPLRPLYTRGYDCGVTDYCHEAHPEE